MNEIRTYHVVAVRTIPRSSQSAESRVIELRNTQPRLFDDVRGAGNDCRVLGHVAPQRQGIERHAGVRARVELERER